MSILNIILSVGFLFIVSCSEPVSQKEEIGQVNNNILEPLSYLEVELTDNFWKPKIEINSVNGLISVFVALTTAIDNFDIVAGKKGGEHDAWSYASKNILDTINPSVQLRLEHRKTKQKYTFSSLFKCGLRSV